MRLERRGETLSCAVAMLFDPFDSNAHAARTARNRAHGSVEVRSGKIGAFHLGDLFGLGARELADLVAMGLAASLVDLRRLLDQHARGRRLHHEGEAFVRVRGNHHRHRQARLDALGLRVESLAKLHDVQPALAERWPDRRAWVRFARRHLQLDISDDFLCHYLLLIGSKRMLIAPSPPLTAASRPRFPSAAATASLRPSLAAGVPPLQRRQIFLSRTAWRNNTP